MPSAQFLPGREPWVRHASGGSDAGWATPSSFHQSDNRFWNLSNDFGQGGSCRDRPCRADGGGVWFVRQQLLCRETASGQHDDARIPDDHATGIDADFGIDTADFSNQRQLSASEPSGNSRRQSGARRFVCRIYTRSRIGHRRYRAGIGVLRVHAHHQDVLGFCTISPESVSQSTDVGQSPGRRKYRRLSGAGRRRVGDARRRWGAVLPNKVGSPGTRASPVGTHGSACL